MEVKATGTRISCNRSADGPRRRRHPRAAALAASRSAAGQQAREDVLGAPQVLGHRRAPRASRRARAPPRAGAGAGRWRRRAPPAGARCSAIRSVIAPCASVIAAHEPRRAGGLGEPDVQAHVGLAVGGEVLERALERRRELVERVEVGAVGALGGEHRDAHLDREALVAGLAPLREQLRARAARPAAAGRPRTCRRRGRASRTRGRSGSARSAPGAASSGRSRAARTARARPAAASPGGSSPSLIAVPRRSTVSSKAVCERTGANTASGGGRRGRVLSALAVVLIRRCDHRRSKPRTRSQSVTAASKAVELDVGGVEVVRRRPRRRTPRARRRCAANSSRASRSGRRQARALVRRVGVALERRLELEARVDAVQPGGDDRAERQVGVQVGAADAVLEAQRRAVADHAQRARAVVVAPGDRRRREARRRRSACRS